MKRLLLFILLLGFLASCSSSSSSPGSVPGPASPFRPAPRTTSSPDFRGIPVTPLSGLKIPNFDHILVVLLENRDYSEVVGSKKMPVFNRLADENVLLTRYHAVAHPSLPNYIALIGGSTFGINSDCTDCFLDQPSLPDLIEASGRTWKTYQEDLPSPCFVGSKGEYAQRHNPFIYFDAIRNDAARCQKSVVPLTELDRDLQNNDLPNFAFIMPNLCHSGHDCSISASDQWLSDLTGRLLDSPALGHKYLLFIAFDESERDNSSCCGLPEEAGGHIPAVLVSPLAKKAFREDTPFSHYSFLKTVLAAWNLPALGYTALPSTRIITSPWEK